MDQQPTTDQAATQSVEERIASKFGVSAEEQAPTEVESTQSAESELADIEWEGETYKVPSKLKDAFMRNEDYTKKTQDLAGRRREAEQAREIAIQRQLDAAFGDQVSNESREIGVIDAYLAQAGKQDWSSMTTDQVLRTKIELDNIKDRRVELQRAIDAKRGKFQQERTSKLDELRGKSREVVSKSIKDFGEETEKAVRSFAQAEGLADTEIDNILLDPRSYKIIYKAMQYERVQAGTQEAADKAGKASDRVLRPGAADNRMPPETVAKLNYRKAMKAATTSGEKARLIEARLASGLFK